MWKDIEGQEGRYQVGDDGRVRSLISGRVLKLRPDEFGYPRAKLYRPGGGFSYVRVHRLVLETFIGPCPEGMECCHNDGDPANNALSNLRWDTRSANQNDRARHGTSNRGVRNGIARMTPEKVRVARQMLRSGESQQSVANSLGVSRGAIQAIAERKTWGHVA